MTRRTLELWGLGSVEKVTSLLVSELVANVIVHAQSECRLSITYDGERLRVGVSDDSSHPPERHRRSSLAATGRGLSLLEELATSWGWSQGAEGGKEVWFELDAPDHRAPVEA